MNGILARANFENAVKLFYNAFNRNPDGSIINPSWNPIEAFKLTQSTLRMEQPIVNNTTVYQFPVLVNVNNGSQQQFNTEIRLNMQDTFVPTEIHIGVAKPSGTDASDFKILTYEAPATFSAAASQALLNLWNGTLEIKVNKDVKLTNWDLDRHYFAPQTQQTAAPGAGSPIDQINGADDGWYPMEPYVLLIGSQGIQTTITLPNAISTVDANSRIVVRMRGVLAQNSTVVS